MEMQIPGEAQEKECDVELCRTQHDILSSIYWRFAIVLQVLAEHLTQISLLLMCIRPIPGEASPPRNTACDGAMQHDGDMQQNRCRVELYGFSVELGGRGFKSCARVRGM